jgi:dihydroorotate dehydrogenase
MPILRHGIPQKLSRSPLVRAPEISRSTRHLFTKSAPVKRTPIRTGLYTTAFVLSTGVLAVYYFDARSALHRYILTPILRSAFDVETGHKIAVKALKSGLAPKDPVGDDERLKAQVSSVLMLLQFS